MTQWFVFPDYTWNPLEWVRQRLKPNKPRAAMSSQKIDDRSLWAKLHEQWVLLKEKSLAGIESLFSYHITFYKVLRATNKWSLFFVLAALLTVEAVMLPIVYMQSEALWNQALTDKSPMLFSAGVSLVKVGLFVAGVGFVTELMHSLFVRATAAQLRRNMSTLLQDKVNLAHIKEQEKATKDRLDDASLERVLTQEVDRFLDLFINIHKFGIFVSYWALKSTMSLISIGLMREGLILLVVGVVGAYLLSNMLSISESGEAYRAHESKYENTIRHLLRTNKQSAQLPNFIKLSTKASRQASEGLYTNGNKADYFHELGQALSMVIFKITEPLLVLALFVGTYLATSMTYSDLQQHLSSLSQLFFCASSSLFYVSQISMLRVYAKHLRRVMVQYFSGKTEEKPQTFDGLRASGLKKFKADASTTPSSNKSRIVQFMAEVKTAASQQQDGRLYRNYYTKDTADNNADSQPKPLEFAVNELVYVVGRNSAGKSVFFNALSGLVPGLETEQVIKEDPHFALYCEQEMISLPETDDSIDQKPWTPLQILYMLWPEDQTFEIEKLSPASKLNFTDRSDIANPVKKDVLVSQLKDSMDTYLKVLGFKQGSSIKTVDGIIDHHIDFNKLSPGNQAKMRLAIYFTMAKILKPRLFFIDEPYNHIDEPGRKAVRKIIDEMKTNGCFDKTTVFVITHEDNDNHNLHRYDKVMAVQAKDQSIGYYGERGENNLLGKTGYFQYQEANLRDQTTTIPATTRYGMP